MREASGHLWLRLILVTAAAALSILAFILLTQVKSPTSPPARTPSWERYDEIATYLEGISPRTNYHALPPVPQVIHSGSLDKIRFRRGHYVDARSLPEYELLLMRVGPDKMQDTCKLFFDGRMELIGVGRRQYNPLPPPAWATIFRSQD